MTLRETGIEKSNNRKTKTMRATRHPKPRYWEIKLQDIGRDGQTSKQICNIDGGGFEL